MLKLVNFDYPLPRFPSITPLPLSKDQDKLTKDGLEGQTPTHPGQGKEQRQNKIVVSERFWVFKIQILM